MRDTAFALLLALACSCLGSCATASHPDSEVEILPLVVASDLDNMPFAGLDAEGTPIGRDVEMMEAIAAALGRPLRWHRAEFETLLPSAQGGWPDVVCATIGITEERARKVAFSRPYFETEIAVVVRTGEGEPRNWDDLAGRVVAASPGTTSEKAVLHKLPRTQATLWADKQGLGVAERLLLGEIDGIAMDGPNAEALVLDSGGALTTLPAALAPERYALVVPPNRTALLVEINAALQELEQSGQSERLNGKWGLRPTPSSSDN
ncbi:MAG: ABC transporter substrate-binding protein [Planctomycetota bacterium]|jgi:glutamine transport system substrate-binding protein|nr:ABC transporter substrate-binding protein [Planctomycetota bacterium]